MVAKYLLLDQSKEDFKQIPPRRPYQLIILGALVVTLLWFLVTHNWGTSVNINYDAIISDRRNRNYDDLYKIYKNFSPRQLIVWNSFENGQEVSEYQKISDVRVVCYYVTAFNLTRSRQLSPNAVDPYLCTHIIIGFAIVLNATIQPQLPTDIEVYKSILSLKNVNPSLKILISVEDFSSKGEFSRVVSSEELRTKFVIDTLAFLNSSGFDGIDLDWEFPSWPDADLIQTRNYTLLLGKFRELINESSYDVIKNFILSVAVGAPELIMRQSYEIMEMAKKVDFVNLMSYDYHMFSQYLPLTGPNAPLYQRSVDEGFMQTLNTNWSALHWYSEGMPKSKINVGIPTYGHSFRLINQDNNGWNAPAAGFGKTGGGNGFLAYPEACKFLEDVNTVHLFDDEYDVPYAYNGNEWISYENPTSVELKAKYVKENKFGGAMIYSLNCDDFLGQCSSQKFSLTRIISNILTS